MRRFLLIIPIFLATVFTTVTAADVISRAGSWTTGLTHTAAAGSNRLLIFEIGYENNSGDVGDASSVTYGGQALTFITSSFVQSSNSFAARAQLWYLDEAGIAAATNNTFSIIWPGASPQQPAYGAATFQNVDQASPIVDFSSAFVDGSTPNPITTNVTVVTDGLSLAMAQCGNNGSYSWNNGWIEGIDQALGSSVNSAADNQETADGTSTASATHSNPNRQVIVAASLSPASVAGQPPVVSDIPDQTVAEGASFTTINLDSYVTDADNLPSEMTWTYSGNTELTVSIDVNRVATITIPTVDWNGSETITFTATDPGLLFSSDPAVFTVTAVNDAPVLASIGAQVVDEGANLNIGVSASDADGTIPALTAENIPTNATFTDNADGTGTFDFNPDFTQSGPYNVRFIASDGVLADTEVVAITVNHVNLAPVLAGIGAQVVDEGANLNFGVSATDADGTIPALTAEDVPTNAIFVDNADGTGTFDFNPDFTQSGPYNVRFIASDGALADTEVVAITVNHVNLAPVLAGIGAQVVDEGSNLNFGV